MRRTVGMLAVVALLAAGIVATAVSPAMGSSPRSYVDKQAESRLRNGLATALTYFTDDDTFSGFDAREAAEIEWALRWADGDRVSVGVVNVGQVRPDRVMLETLSRSGASFCIAASVDWRSMHYYFGWDPTPGKAFGTFAGCRNAADWPD